jgi:hypothetical protein
MGEVIKLNNNQDEKVKELEQKQNFLNEQVQSNTAQLSAKVNGMFFYTTIIIGLVTAGCMYLGKYILYKNAINYNIPTTSSYYKFLDYQSTTMLTLGIAGMFFATVFSLFYLVLRVKNETKKSNIDLIERTLNLRQEPKKNNHSEYEEKKVA